VTLVTSLVSLLTGLPVPSDLAMTGEITLRGKVLPVGGIKEKVIAAKSAGSARVVLPDKNEKDLEDVTEPVRKSLRFTFVSEIDEVLDAAFGPELRRRAAAFTAPVRPRLAREDDADEEPEAAVMQVEPRGDSPESAPRLAENRYGS
jgi:ATP-dependent Lon protease